MNAKPMRLIRPKDREREESRAEKALREIVAEHVRNNWTPIDTGNNGEPLPTDTILQRSYRPTDREK